MEKLIIDLDNKRILGVCKAKDFKAQIQSLKQKQGEC